MRSAGAATQEVWRLFVAVELPGEVRQRMRHIRDTLKAAGWKARWTNPDSTHLTLKFFGNQPSQQHRSPDWRTQRGGEWRDIIQYLHRAHGRISERPTSQGDLARRERTGKPADISGRGN